MGALHPGVPLPWRSWWMPVGVAGVWTNCISYGLRGVHRLAVRVFQEGSFDVQGSQSQGSVWVLFPVAFGFFVLSVFLLGSWPCALCSLAVSVERP